MNLKRLVAAMLFFGVIGGCRARSDADYVPDEAVARGALAAALDAWKAGGTPDKIEVDGHAIQAQDPNWQASRQLSGYEIVGPAPGAEPHRAFKVQLDLPEGRQEAVYVVLGKDPIWVFNEVSFQQLSGAGG